MRKLGVILSCFLIVLFGVVGMGRTASDTPFVKDFKSWKLLKSYKFPCESLSSAPKVVRELGAMLCPLLTPESKVEVYVRPKAEKALKGGKEYPDGVNFAYFISHVKGVGDIVILTAHDLGEPKYGAYKMDGSDIEGAVKVLKKSVCVSCHSVYCPPAGVCANQSWNNIH